MSDGTERLAKLNSAIEFDVPAKDPRARKYVELALKGDKPSIARQVFHDLESLHPLPIPDEPAVARSSAISENRRRLRTTMWAEVVLREADPSFAKILSAYHREQWNIAFVQGDDPKHTDQAREYQVVSAVKLKAAR